MMNTAPVPKSMLSLPESVAGLKFFGYPDAVMPPIINRGKLCLMRPPILSAARLPIADAYALY